MIQITVTWAKVLYSFIGRWDFVDCYNINREQAYTARYCFMPGGGIGKLQLQLHCTLRTVFCEWQGSVYEG